MGIGSEEVMTQRNALTFRVSAEVLAVIDAKAAANFCKRAEAASMVLAEAVARDTGAAPSPMADMKERSASLDLEMKETRLAQIRKEILPVEAAIEVVEEVMAAMRTEGLQLMADLANDYNLDAKELERRYLAAMAGPGARAVEREPLEMLADEFSREPLP